jgi:hypothetical protein
VQVEAWFGHGPSIAAPPRFQTSGAARPAH